MNELKKFAYLYQATKGAFFKFKELEDKIPKTQLKRYRTAFTHLDNAIAETLSIVDNRDDLRNYRYILNSHETCMIPSNEKIKHLKNLGKVRHLQNIRAVVTKEVCNKCSVSKKEECNIRLALKEAGTESYWDYNHLDVLMNQEKKWANHCEFCGGFKK